MYSQPPAANRVDGMQNLTRLDPQEAVALLKKGAEGHIGFVPGTDHLTPLKELEEGDSATIRNEKLEYVASRIVPDSDPDANEQGRLSALDYHLLAVVHLRLGGKNLPLAAAPFERARARYEQEVDADRRRAQRGLHALFLSDYARFWAATNQHSKAQIYYDQAISKLQSEVPPAFAIYCNCQLANSYRAVGSWEKAKTHLLKAEGIADSALPKEHPLVAFVAERKAWFLMDQWQFKDARSHFQRAKRLRQQDLLGKPYMFHNWHGELAAARYLPQAEMASLDKEYGDLVTEIEKELPDKSPDQRKDLLTRICNSIDRYADFHLYSCNPTDVIAGLAGREHNDDTDELLKYASRISKWVDVYQEEPDKPDLTSLLYKRAIIWALRRECGFAQEWLQAATEEDERIQKSRSPDGAPAARLTSEYELLRNVANAIIPLATRGQTADDKQLADEPALLQAQAELRSVLLPRMTAAQFEQTKRDDLELLLFSAALLVESHSLLQAPSPLLNEDARRLKGLSAYLLRRGDSLLLGYLRRYYDSAIRARIAAADSDWSTTAHWILEAKYGESFPNPARNRGNVAVFYVLPKSVVAVVLNADADSRFLPDCFRYDQKLRVVQKPPLRQNARSPARFAGCDHGLLG